MTRDFKAIPAVRKSTPLLIGIAGPPGSGKTFSLLRIATGIKAHRGGPIVFLDTERNRALRYAPAEGKKADGVNNFDFMHVAFNPPFSSADFLDAVRQQRVHRPSCIIIDSMSDEHEGEDGVLDFHDKELDRMAGDDWSKRDRMTQAAWIKPKRERLVMMNGLFQLMTPILFGFRAREKTKQVPNEKGKMVPTNIGWTPIAPSEIVHAMDLFAILPVKSDGVPMWKGNTAYEDFTIKLPRQFEGLFPVGKQIGEDMGEAMSIWAAGDTKFGKEAEKDEPPKPELVPRATGRRGPSSEPQETALPMSGSKSGQRAQAPVQGPESQPDDAWPSDLHSDPSTEVELQQSDETEDVAPIPEDRLDFDEEIKSDTWRTFDMALSAAPNWPSIQRALETLIGSTDWKAAVSAVQNDARRRCYARLNDLVNDGYDFDGTQTLHSWRCMIEWINNVPALEQYTGLAESSDEWRAATPEIRNAFAKAIAARKRALAG